MYKGLKALFEQAMNDEWKTNERRMNRNADSNECAFISREKKAIFVVKLEENDNRHKTEDYE